MLTSYHCSRVFPLGQFVEDPQQINAGKKISPAELIVVSCFLKNTKCKINGLSSEKQTSQ